LEPTRAPLESPNGSKNANPNIRTEWQIQGAAISESPMPMKSQ
jgi:hypothetical protein